jgi:hypothetical protein
VTRKWDALPAQPHCANFSGACVETHVQPAAEGIGTSNTLDGFDSEPTEEAGRDSEFDENAEISELEKRDFDDVEGMEVDVEQANYHRNCCSPCFADTSASSNQPDSWIEPFCRQRFSVTNAAVLS